MNYVQVFAVKQTKVQGLEGKKQNGLSDQTTRIDEENEIIIFVKK